MTIPLFTRNTAFMLAGFAVALSPIVGMGAEDANSPFNDKTDGGAAVYTQAAPAGGKLVSDNLAAQYPVGQQARMYVLGGSVRGFGMLAAYDSPGKRSFVVSRRTQLGTKEPYTPVALARVFDPKGNLVLVEEFTEQTKETDCRVLEIPNGAPGIWRVSFSGGRKDDLVEIRLKDTAIWGVRGEMALGVTESTPRPAYLWVPATSKQLLMGLESGTPNGVELRDSTGKNVLAKPVEDPTRRVGRLFIDPAPANTVCRVQLPAKFSGAIVFAGAPGLLCPSEQAARRLLGGTVESHGVITSGPLQARAREWMVAAAPKLDLHPNFEMLKSLPEKIDSPEIQVLAFGKYGPLNHLTSMIEEQNKHLDPASPYFGGTRDPAKDGGAPTWHNFHTYRNTSMWDAPALASAAAFESPLNPAYRSEALIQRTVLTSFGNLVAMQGDDLIREGTLFKTRYPMTHAFFVYAAETQSFNSLKDMLPEDAKAIWKQGVMAIGDKIADFQGYQSNQWAHMLRAHLEVYMATGEKRFLGYFERMMTAYLDNVFGPGSKFGQHPAGFFLEECGPDGNYDKLNSFNVVSCYQDYRELPAANPVLVQKLKTAIDKNLRFASFFWLPDAEGKLTSPTAMNCRTMHILAGTGYPGAFLPKSEFPLAAARFALTPAPKSGMGEAATFTCVANTDEWIRTSLASSLAAGPGQFSGAGGTWLPILAKGYSLPQKVKPALIPVQEIGGTWTLPGLLAWNRSGLYGVTFHDVIGANQTLKGMMGGGPSALWTKATGPFVCSMYPGKVPEHPSLDPFKDEKSLTFSCVYGKDSSGELFYSGKERSELKVLSEGKQYEINGKVTPAALPLNWGYTLGANDLKLSVQFKGAGQVKEPFLNLPLSKRASDAKVQLVGRNALLFETAKGSVRMEWPQAYAGELKASMLKDVERLVIPLPRDGSPLVIKISEVASPVQAQR